MFETDIPDECNDCLQITLDNDTGGDKRQTIGVAWEYNHNDSIINVCDHDMYYWQTGLSRGTDTARKMHVMAECDECSTFVLSALITNCKTEN